MSRVLVTLPGELVEVGCVKCNPAMIPYNERLHEGHFSADLGDWLATVTIDGEKVMNVREIIIDRATRLARVWAYPLPDRICECGGSVAQEVWDHVPGVSVRLGQP